MTTALAACTALIYAAAAFGFWRLGARLAERLGKRAGEAVALAAVAFVVASVLLVNWFPSSIPAGWTLTPAIHLEFAYFPPAALVMFGLGAKRIPRPETGRALRVLSAAIGLYGAAHLFLSMSASSLPDLSEAPPPGPVQAQSTHWSCGAASAVNLLAAHGIRSTEREMGELCLTMPYRGTTTPRFVRGLTRKLEAEGSRLRVRAEDRLTLEELDRFPRPCLVGVRGSLLVGHAVVLLESREPGRYRVANPLPIGLGSIQSIPRGQFASGFTGEAIALE
jgi:hypothetical protein